MVTPELIGKVKQSIKTAADAQYFFDNLKTAEWVTPLREAGFFRDPLGPVAQGDTMVFPIWPQSRYLARIADQSPEAVLAAIKNTLTTAIHEFMKTSWMQHSNYQPIWLLAWSRDHLSGVGRIINYGYLLGWPIWLYICQ